ncbi:MAG: PQQ-binding-like beta-propeller repeat protein [Solirubrobacteraceae bacterium]
MSSGRSWTKQSLGALGAVAVAVLVACGGQATGAANRTSTGAANRTSTGAANPASASATSATVNVPSSASSTATSVPSGDWTTFDYNAQRSGVGPADTGITAANLHLLRRRPVALDGTVDSSAIELHAIVIDGRARDVIVVTTSYGHTIAIDAATGRKLWEFAPSDLKRLEGTPQITAASPVADPDRQYVYAASPDGYIHKLALATGLQVWATSITFDPTHEKLPSALNISGRSVIATTDGYIGDIPPYQGHVVLIDRVSGQITAVWNSLCSNLHQLIDPPSSCRASDSGIWGRSGTVIEPATGRILVATGNAPFNGSTDWGDSVLELSPTLALLHNWTPVDQAYLNSSDGDLGSTEPALLGDVRGSDLAVQGGKDGILRLLDLDRLDGTTGPAGPRTGGELQQIDAPGSTDVFTEPAVWTSGGRINVFVADNDGTADYVLGADRRLHIAWQNGTPGTSPVVAGALLYVYDQLDGLLKVYRPASGDVLASLPAASGHWNSPIVVGGRIILPVGNDNDHRNSGTLYIYHLPGR